MNLDFLAGKETPFYYYNIKVLEETLAAAKLYSEKYNYILHYAIKANSNPKILKLIASYGLGADCVSGNEILAAIAAGFPSDKILFAGVGKTDKEIKIGIENNISCFNVESLPEMEVINSIAFDKKIEVNIALRINPNVDAKTHKNITTGTEENKFGFNIPQLEEVLKRLKKLNNLRLIGVHYHIGSQIENLEVFRNLCVKVIEVNSFFEGKRIHLEHINVGGGLGVDYANPSRNMMPKFEEYFNIFHSNLHINKNIHFELGRSIVAQCGSLISRVVYVKEGELKKFIILDASMTELIRPALYGAVHKIENLSSNSKKTYKYDIVGPVCESSDTFAVDYDMCETNRGDIIEIKTAGAYGEVMASQYNLRNLPKAYFSDSN